MSDTAALSGVITNYAIPVNLQQTFYRRKGNGVKFGRVCWESVYIIRYCRNQQEEYMYGHSKAGKAT